MPTVPKYPEVIFPKRDVKIQLLKQVVVKAPTLPTTVIFPKRTPLA